MLNRSSTHTCVLPGMYFCGLLLRGSAALGGGGSGCSPGALGVPAGRQAEGRQACVQRNRSTPACGGSPDNNTTLGKGNRVRKLCFGQLTVTASPEWFFLRKGRGGWAGGAWRACPDLCYLWESRYQSQSISCSHFQSTIIEQP